MIGLDIASNFHFPLVAVGEKLLLVIQKLLSGLCAELKVGTFNDGINGTRFLTKTAINALGHVNVVAGGTTRVIFTGFRLDRNGLCWTNRLAQLARYATFLTRSVSPQSMLSAKSRAKRILLVRIHNRIWGAEKVLENYKHPPYELSKQEQLSGFVEGGGCFVITRAIEFGISFRIHPNFVVRGMQLARSVGEAGDLSDDRKRAADRWLSFSNSPHVC